MGKDILVFLPWNKFHECTYVHFSITPILKGVLLSNMGKLFVVPAIIWGQSNSLYYLVLIYYLVLTRIFIFTSNSQALRGKDFKTTSLCDQRMRVCVLYCLAIRYGHTINTESELYLIPRLVTFPIILSWFDVLQKAPVTSYSRTSDFPPKMVE
jgi:hypothetical protein